MTVVLRSSRNRCGHFIVSSTLWNHQKRLMQWPKIDTYIILFIYDWNVFRWHPWSWFDMRLNVHWPGQPNGMVQPGYNDQFLSTLHLCSTHQICVSNVHQMPLVINQFPIGWGRSNLTRCASKGRAAWHLEWLPDWDDAFVIIFPWNMVADTTQEFNFATVCFYSSCMVCPGCCRTHCESHCCRCHRVSQENICFQLVSAFWQCTPGIVLFLQGHRFQWPSLSKWYNSSNSETHCVSEYSMLQ